VIIGDPGLENGDLVNDAAASLPFHEWLVVQELPKRVADLGGLVRGGAVESFHFVQDAYDVAERETVVTSLDKRANAKWLFLDVSVRNDDKKAKTIPPFQLIDENGAEYESSAEATLIEGSIGAIDSLNPSVTKQGLVVFDVPKNHQYRLKASGGYCSGESGFIRITPAMCP